MVLQDGKTGQNVKAPLKFLLPTLILSPAIDEEEEIVAKHPPKIRRHGREYSLQLKATDKPITVKEDSVTVEASVPVPPIEVIPKRLSRPPPPPPHDPAFLSPRNYQFFPLFPSILSDVHNFAYTVDAKRIARQQHMQSFPPRHRTSSTRDYSVEEEFARRFGYELPSYNNIAPNQEIAFFTSFEDSHHLPPVRKPRPRSTKVHSVIVDENEEGFLVLLPPPSLCEFLC
ncbi:hypothetical protein Clacol_008702 [Clathrus columnatus]|uniref:Uncharacterized protein n=1 Tax=Clathrus columnatus TaxID=1419009 RepID=A0AAV5AN03_9AGAM|nr:hypothetical protein Clacol_008702 [Clathrus columnatus]